MKYFFAIAGWHIFTSGRQFKTTFPAMTRILTFVLLSLHVVACGQTTKGEAKGDITTTKSTRHQNIPGTRVFVVPPGGFTVSPTLPAIL